MNIEILVLRWLHIAFGVFWAGSAIFIALILEPQLRALGPTHQRPVMGALARVLGPVLGGSAIITIVAGLTMALILSGGNLNRFVTTGWGWAILIGFIVSIAAFTLGMTSSVTANRLARLGRSIEGRPPKPEEIQQMQRYGGRLTTLGRTTTAMVFVAVVTMASARFV